MSDSDQLLGHIHSNLQPVSDYCQLGCLVAVAEIGLERQLDQWFNAQRLEQPQTGSLFWLQLSGLALP